VEIVLATCVLRDWRAGDEPSLVRHADNPNVARNLAEVFPHPYSLDDARSWIRENAGVEPVTRFAIIVDGEACGGIGIEIGSDIHRRSAEIGYWLGERFWGRGIVTEALKAVTGYAFDAFDLAHVFAGTFERNAGSRRVLEKAGYVLEGRLRQHVTKDGVTMDDLVYGIVRDSRVEAEARRTISSS
jgi:RimJ/RimL family protein N-acetyltransferase